MHPEVRREERIAERPGGDREARAATDHGLPALGLVRPQEDPGTIERSQRAFEAVLPDQPREIAPLAAREAEEVSVGTPGLGVDRAPDELQEDRVARAEALADHGTRRVGRRGAPEEARQAQQQPGAAPEVPDTIPPGARGRRRGADRFAGAGG